MADDDFEFLMAEIASPPVVAPVLPAAAPTAATAATTTTTPAGAAATTATATMAVGDSDDETTAVAGAAPDSLAAAALPPAVASVASVISSNSSGDTSVVLIPDSAVSDADTAALAAALAAADALPLQPPPHEAAVALLRAAVENVGASRLGPEHTLVPSLMQTLGAGGVAAHEDREWVLAALAHWRALAPVTASAPALAGYLAAASATRSCLARGVPRQASADDPPLLPEARAEFQSAIEVAPWLELVGAAKGTSLLHAALTAYAAKLGDGAAEGAMGAVVALLLHPRAAGLRGILVAADACRDALLGIEFVDEAAAAARPRAIAVLTALLGVTPAAVARRALRMLARWVAVPTAPAVTPLEAVAIALCPPDNKWLPSPPAAAFYAHLLTHEPALAAMLVSAAATVPGGQLSVPLTTAARFTSFRNVLLYAAADVRALPARPLPGGGGVTDLTSPPRASADSSVSSVTGGGAGPAGAASPPRATPLRRSGSSTPLRSSDSSSIGGDDEHHVAAVASSASTWLASALRALTSGTTASIVVALGADMVARETAASKAAREKQKAKGLPPRARSRSDGKTAAATAAAAAAATAADTVCNMEPEAVRRALWRLGCRNGGIDDWTGAVVAAGLLPEGDAAHEEPNPVHLRPVEAAELFAAMFNVQVDRLQPSMYTTPAMEDPLLADTPWLHHPRMWVRLGSSDFPDVARPALSSSTTLYYPAFVFNAASGTALLREAAGVDDSDEEGGGASPAVSPGRADAGDDGDTDGDVPIRRGPQPQRTASGATRDEPLTHQEHMLKAVESGYYVLAEDAAAKTSARGNGNQARSGLAWGSERCLQLIAVRNIPAEMRPALGIAADVSDELPPEWDRPPKRFVNWKVKPYVRDEVAVEVVANLTKMAGRKAPSRVAPKTSMLTAMLVTSLITHDMVARAIAQKHAAATAAAAAAAAAAAPVIVLPHATPPRSGSRRSRSLEDGSDSVMTQPLSAASSITAYGHARRARPASPPVPPAAAPSTIFPGCWLRFRVSSKVDDTGLVVDCGGKVAVLLADGRVEYLGNGEGVLVRLARSRDGSGAQLAVTPAVAAPAWRDSVLASDLPAWPTWGSWESLDGLSRAAAAPASVHRVALLPGGILAAPPPRDAPAIGLLDFMAAVTVVASEDAVARRLMGRREELAALLASDVANVDTLAVVAQQYRGEPSRFVADLREVLAAAQNVSVGTSVEFMTAAANIVASWRASPDPESGGGGGWDGRAAPPASKRPRLP